MSLHLTVNGLAIPYAAAVRITQSYEEFGGFTTLRLGDGAAVQQSTWSKLRTTIAADGRMPAGLAAVDWRANVTLGCIRHRAIQSASNIIVIPAARRSDVAPFGFALLPGAAPVRTPVGVASNTATLTPVAGAVGYAVHYFPLLTVVSAGPVETGEASSNAAGWTLQAEEA